MREEANEKLLEDADILLNRPDREIMALALSKNDRWAENYLTAMIIKLRTTIGKLNTNIIEFDRTSRKASNTLIWLNVILIILTLLLAWQTYMLSIKG